MNELGYGNVADKLVSGHRYCEGTKKYLPPVSNPISAQSINATRAPLSGMAGALIGISNTMVNHRSVTDYLNNNPTERKVLVVGCGSTPENVTMGVGNNEMHGVRCSLGRKHNNDFTIDISTEAGADLTINLLEKKTVNSNLEERIKFEIQGFRKFDDVHFEYLCKGLPGKNRENVFSSDEIETGIVSAHNLLKVGGKITFYNGSDNYRSIAVKKMNELGYGNVADKLVSGHRYCEGTKKYL
jgi:hypothetical protein